jgi:glycosyltransferase involved in cell wall biosynthesis
MRVALISTYPPSAGTLNEYAFHFVRALRSKPEVSEVIVLADELPADQEYSDQDEAGIAPLTILPCWRFDGLNNLLRIGQAVHQVDADVVLFNIQFASFGGGKVPGALGLLVPLLVKLMGYPTIVLLHNIMETVDLRNAGYAANPIMERLIRYFGAIITWLVLQADRVALTIPKYVEILATKYRAQNVLLAPHGSFEDEVEMPSFDLPAGPMQVMTFGKFGTYKRIEQLIEAVQLLETQGYGPLELVIAGTDSPNAQGYLAQMREQYAHVPNVRYTGYVAEEDVPRIFGDSAVVVFPYTSTTGSSGVLHQAGSYGRAVVLPQIGDLAELIHEEGYDGEFFVPGDVPSLAAAIAAILSDPARRKELGKRNFLAARGLPIADVVDWYLLHFESILATRGTRRRRNNRQSVGDVQRQKSERLVPAEVMN